MRDEIVGADQQRLVGELDDLANLPGYIRAIDFKNLADASSRQGGTHIFGKAASSLRPEIVSGAPAQHGERHRGIPPTSTAYGRRE
ncbi:hypothetical protein Ahu01nite_028290 [Winogradskya humida]|uniref:Uncharacterized protein n=1 Tax=Winogradskya humida TaxID=113566 RepID=A0ABQ3ZMB9_9ACTN|nr:hypothetical protein Ahu01nite_028290 [Actinoplanes humidus]